MSFLPVEIIMKKRDGKILSLEEIDFFVQNYTQNKIPDYQMSALLMSICLNGMNTDEQLYLTRSMLHSGKIVEFRNLPHFKVDKHSTGGVGDKTSLILGPIVAAAGIPVPMISGRGLGHTGGTLDKLESIPGFNTQLDLEKFSALVKKSNLCFIGQTQEICPADKKMYALRDVTGTVESLPLICASILSKKLAEGIDGLVLDVKYGSGAFMKTKEKARELASNLMSIAKKYGKNAFSLITNMNQPLGRFSGNSLEVEECLNILNNKTFFSVLGRDLYYDTRELSLQLASSMIWLSGMKSTREEAYQYSVSLLKTGAALRKFQEVIFNQGGDINKLPSAQHKYQIVSKNTGYLASYKTDVIGFCGIKIGAGRSKIDDIIDPTAGIEFHFKQGDLVNRGDCLFTIYGNDFKRFDSIIPDLLNSVDFSINPPEIDPLILDYF